MKVKTHKAKVPASASAGENSFLALMRVLQPSSPVTKTTTQAPVTNTMRATTMTVVLEEILTHRDHPYGRINE